MWGLSIPCERAYFLSAVAIITQLKFDNNKMSTIIDNDYYN